MSECGYSYTQCARTLQGEYFLVWMHNGRVCGDWSSEDIVGVGQVHNDDLVGFIDLFPNTDEMVGLQRESLY